MFIDNMTIQNDHVNNYTLTRNQLNANIISVSGTFSELTIPI